MPALQAGLSGLRPSVNSFLQKEVSEVSKVSKVSYFTTHFYLRKVESENKIEAI